jgi:hypothetical protein
MNLKVSSRMGCFLSAVVFVAGCQSLMDAQNRWEKQPYANCQSYGFQPNTPQYSECVERQFAARRKEQADALRKSTPQHSNTNCTTYGNQTNCSTTTQ